MASKRGNPRLAAVRPSDTAQANARRTALADAFAKVTLEALRVAYHDDNIRTNAERAKWLNQKGYRTRRGGLWSKKAVERLVKRVTRPGFVGDPGV